LGHWSPFLGTGVPGEAEWTHWLRRSGFLNVPFAYGQITIGGSAADRERDTPVLPNPATRPRDTAGSVLSRSPGSHGGRGGGARLRIATVGSGMVGIATDATADAVPAGWELR
jgi:hypothetical protein